MMQDKKHIASILLESIPDIAILIDTDGNILMINKAGAESLGGSVDQIIGKNAIDLVSEDVYELRRSKWTQVIRTKKISYMEDERGGKYFETWFCPIFDSEGKVEFIAIFAHDVTNHKKTEKALRESEEKFRLVMEVTNDAMWDWNLNTNEVYRNPRHATMLGYAPHELTASQEEWEKRIHPDDRDAVLQKLNEHLAGNVESVEIEYRLKTKSGDYVWVLGRGKVVEYNKDGTPARVIGTNIDITERKRAEEANSEYQTLIRGIMNNSNSIVVVRNPQGQYIMVNKEVENLLGMESEQIIGKTPFDIYTNDKANRILADDRKVIESRNVLKIEDKLDFNDETRIFEGTRFPLINLSGEVYAVCTVAMDITERKKQYERDKIILKTCIDGFWVIDTQGKILEVNDAYCQMSGYSRDELLSMSIQDIDTVEEPEEILQHIQGVIDKGSHRFESRHRRKDGKIMDLDISAHYLKLEGGRLFTFIRDITASKQAEREIRKFKTIAEKAGHGVGIADFEGNLVYVNDSFAQMHQYSSDELIGKNLSIFHAEEQMDTVNRLNYMLKQNGSYVAEEVWHKKRDNTVFPTLMSGTLVKDEHGEPLFMAATAIDMTEHKRAEEALQESEIRYRTLFEILPVGVGLSALDGRIIDTNSTFQQMIGYSIEELKRVNAPNTYYNPAERALLLKQIQQNGFVRDFEARLKRKDGSTFLASMNITAVKIRNETILVTVAKDITEQRGMEKALTESEEKYRTLVECARDPIATIDETGTYLFLNKTAARRLTGKDEDLAGKTLWDFFPKEIADRHAANIRKVIKAKKGVNIVSLTEVQNQLRWYNTTIEPLKDDNGTVTAAIVIARDVDDIKRAEEQIQKLSTAVESSMNGIAIGDIEGNLTYANHAFLVMWGYDNKDEVLGRNATEFWQTKTEGQKVLETVISKGGWIGELTAKRKDGSTFDVQICGTLTKDENGKPISLMGSFVDISEMKRNEEELSRYRGQMARAEQLASLGTLSATIAHQLTQPLTVIRLSLDNALDELEESSSSRSVIRRLRESVTQVSNITSIIERFRNFARKSSGRTVAEVNLKLVAIRITSLLSESARSARITLRINDMDDLICTWISENDLEQLFFALIENAIQAADSEKARQLVIDAAVKDEHIELRVSDDCGGIPPENIDRIFEPFFTTKPRGQGTGLGLCIVQDVVSRSGGRIEVESEYGKGTTFIIRLPFGQNKIS